MSLQFIRTRLHVRLSTLTLWVGRGVDTVWMGRVIDSVWVERRVDSVGGKGVDTVGGCGG